MGDTARKRKCSFTDCLQERFPCFKKGRNMYEAECKVCPAGTFIAVSHKGALDLECHMKTAKHVKNLKAANSSSKLSTFFNKKESAVEYQVRAAEGTLAFHTVRHHHSFNSMNCTSKLHKHLFKDSKVVKEVSCSKTKTEAIVNSVLSPHSIDVSIETLNGISCFGVATDGSNHGSTKIFPILIQFFDVKKRGLTTKIVEIKSIPNEKAETIAGYIKDTLTRLKISEKCVAFSGDNTNTNFGGVNQRAGCNVLTFLQNSINKKILGAGCPAHVLHNCVQHGLDVGLLLDVESMVLKIFNYFSVYTVRTEELKDFCDFVQIEYRQLLSHSKSRWLSLFPCVHRILQMFPALKSYFFSQSSIPTLIKKFFEDDFSEMRLLFVHSLMSIFHEKILLLEKEKNSLAETMAILEDVHTILFNRKQNDFLSINVKSMLNKKINEGFEQESISFKQEVSKVYEGCIEYIKLWLTQYQNFQVFKWMNLSTIPSWEDVEESVIFYNDRSDVKIDDSLCHDQFCNFVAFLKQHKEEEAVATQKEGEGSKNKLKLSNDVWLKYFNGLDKALYSEILKLVQFFYCIPSHNACVERVFSLMNAQWTKERNRLSIDTIKSILCVQHNFKDISCSEFYDYIFQNEKLLKSIGSSSKYSWYKGPSSGENVMTERTVTDSDTDDD